MVAWIFQIFMENVLPNKLHVVMNSTSTKQASQNIYVRSTGIIYIYILLKAEA